MKLVYGSNLGTDGLEFFPTYEDELSEVFRGCGELGRRVGQLGHAIISVEIVVGWWGVRVGYVDHKALKGNQSIRPTFGLAATVNCLPPGRSSDNLLK